MFDYRRVVLSLYKTLLNTLPLKNYIIFESFPDFSDNTKAVFDEMLKRKYNEKYKLIWITQKNIRRNKKIKNVSSIYCWNHSLFYHLKRTYYLSRARLVITCNMFLKKYSNKQTHFHLSHGAAIKNSSAYYRYPDTINKALCISDYLAETDSFSISYPKDKFVPLGYPRNDDLFININIKSLFKDKKYNKIIYWMPTFRQYKGFGNINIYSDISIPIIYKSEAAKIVNECAKANNVLIVVKPHFAQDISKITKLNLSNIIFINDELFSKNKITNYQFLGNCDALLTDYSSVYYDYLLCDKPIGLCWEDYDIYNKNVGFAVDMDTVMEGGEKIYTTEDLCRFISHVANGEDVLKEQRNELCSLLHKYKDNQSSKRVVDYIEENYLK